MNDADIAVSLRDGMLVMLKLGGRRSWWRWASA
jgi:hypothetical protein